ncbi:MAG: hypothetical protein ACYC5X_13945 [Syntrophales bacterium]
MQQLDFEILFQLGANAIADGYSRDAVGSFTASLERFYEFYIKLICTKHEMSVDLIENSWKKVSNQSERQLGAYIFLYAVENNEEPELLKPSDITFRNEVIHKGKIPSKDEAIKYGEKILKLINPVVYALNKQTPKTITDYVSRHMASLRRKIPEGVIESPYSEHTILSISHIPHEEIFQTLEEGLQSIELRRKQLSKVSP